MIRLTDILNEVKVPKVVYHATYKPLLNKIKANGLDSAKSKKAWDFSEAGTVYFATDIDVAASFAEASDEVPDEWIDQIIVLHINTDKLDKTKIQMDSNVRGNTGESLEYKGTIPWTAITKVTKYE